MLLNFIKIFLIFIGLKFIWQLDVKNLRLCKNFSEKRFFCMQNNYLQDNR